jgi:UDP-N-acetylglucosamine 2-epimerase (non-hydrolysing)
MQPIVLVCGTRAEALKLLPVYFELKKQSLPTLLCATSQHSDLLAQVFDLFGVVPDYNLNVMKPDQDLFHVTTLVLERCRDVYREVNPSLVIVHGDTTTTLAAALAAFYLNIPIAHVEAGLRTGDMRHPFPEEMNRKVVGQFATYHFAPTALATANVLAEGVKRENIFCTGNTIVDALHAIQNKILLDEIKIDEEVRSSLEEARLRGSQIVLLTAHRRESFDGGLERIFAAVKEFAQMHEDITFFYTQHPNPNVARALEKAALTGQHNVVMFKHLAYQDLVYILMNCSWVATDSGGIQEEAVSLGKQVLCLRDVTERHEGVWEGIELLVGTDKNKIIEGMDYFFKNQNHGASHSTLYGDGKASKRIVTILQSCLHSKVHLVDGFAKSAWKKEGRRVHAGA